MLLMVLTRSSISPLTEMVTFCVRSPRATAVVACAIVRACSVRLAAIVFTESVRSFQVPSTPSTFARPPSLPSVPTSVATRVTSVEKVRRLSTMLLTVFFKSRNSPRTSTLMVLLRSPRATAVLTVAMERTCVVRFEAIMLTRFVSTSHWPLTSSTLAWPPRRPSVPTSTDTRIISSDSVRNCRTMLLTVSLSSRISPWTSTVINSVSTPSATHLVTRAISRTCDVRLSAILLTLSVRSFQIPSTFGTLACPPRRPNVPTSSDMRTTSLAKTRS